MRQKIDMAVLIVALMVVGFTPGLVLAQAPTVPLEDQLKAQFTLVKMGTDSGGAAVVEQGTILVIKKGGILSVPYGDQPVATKYQDGAVHSPNSVMMGARGGLMGKLGKKQTTQFFQAGHKSISLQDRRESAERSGNHEHHRLRFLQQRQPDYVLQGRRGFPVRQRIAGQYQSVTGRRHDRRTARVR